MLVRPALTAKLKMKVKMLAPSFATKVEIWSGVEDEGDDDDGVGVHGLADDLRVRGCAAGGEGVRPVT